MKSTSNVGTTEKTLIVQKHYLKLLKVFNIY